jgi:hypothetical protein
MDVCRQRQNGPEERKIIIMAMKTPKFTNHKTTNRAVFSKGGSGHMFDQQAAAPKRPGITGKSDSRGPGKPVASGGDARKSPASPPGAKVAVAGRTSPIKQPTRSSTSTRDYTKPAR